MFLKWIADVLSAKYVVEGLWLNDVPDYLSPYTPSCHTAVYVVL